MKRKMKTYSPEFKIMVVEDYLSGKSGGTAKVAKKYGIPNDYTVSRWTRIYKDFGKEGLENKRGKIRRKLEGKELTSEEKILYLEAENAYLRKMLEHRENILKKKK